MAPAQLCSRCSVALLLALFLGPYAEATPLGDDGKGYPSINADNYPHRLFISSAETSSGYLLNSSSSSSSSSGGSGAGGATYLDSRGYVVLHNVRVLGGSAVQFLGSTSVNTAFAGGRSNMDNNWLLEERVGRLPTGGSKVALEFYPGMACAPPIPEDDVPCSQMVSTHPWWAVVPCTEYVTKPALLLSGDNIGKTFEELHSRLFGAVQTLRELGLLALAADGGGTLRVTDNTRYQLLLAQQPGGRVAALSQWPWSYLYKQLAADIRPLATVAGACYRSLVVGTSALVWMPIAEEAVPAEVGERADALHIVANIVRGLEKAQLREDRSIPALARLSGLPIGTATRGSSSSAGAALRQDLYSPLTREVLTEVARGRPLVAFASRPATFRRGIANEEALAEWVAQRFNVTVVRAWFNGTVADATELLASSSAVVGMCGGGLANLLLLAPPQPLPSAAPADKPAPPPPLALVQMFPYGWDRRAAAGDEDRTPPQGRIYRNMAETMRMGYWQWFNRNASKAFFRRDDFAEYPGATFTQHPAEGDAPPSPMPTYWENQLTEVDFDSLGEVLSRALAHITAHKELND